MYKFLSLDSEHGKDNLSQAIKCMEFWFSSPQDFNDPYECRPIFNNDLNARDMQERYIYLKSVPFNSLRVNSDRIAWLYVNSIPKRAIKRTITEKYISDNIVPELIKKSYEIFNTTGVCCFASEPNSSSMWAYYANSHSGVCIKIKKVKNTTENIITENISYSNARPVVSFSEVTPKNTTSPLEWETVQKFIFTKSKRWEHENEIRTIKLRSANMLVKLENYKIEEIIIGLKTSSEDEHFVQSIAKSHHIPIKYAQLCQTSFDIKVGAERIS